MQQFLQTRLLPGALTAAATSLILGNFSPANAAAFSFSVNPFTGSSAKVNFTLDDTAAGAGKIQFKVDVDSSVSLADLRGVFFNIQDDSLLSGLTINGANVSRTAIDAGRVISVGGGNNLNGGSISGFDVGVEIGREGLRNDDDIRSTIFTLSHSSRALTLSQFANQSFGVRVTSVGTANNRNGSSKLAGTAPQIPAPPLPAPAPAPLPVLPPVVVVPPQPKPPARVPEPGMTAAIVLTAVGGVKLLKRKSIDRISHPPQAEA